MKISCRENLIFGGLVGVLAITGIAVGVSPALAETDSSDVVTVVVPSSCSVGSTIATGSEHSTDIRNGIYKPDIGETTITTFCNDNEGYSVYAIGFSDDTLGKTVLSSSLDDSYDIATGTATGPVGNDDVSNWAMKLTAVSGTFTPTILDTYDAYHAVPSSYAKVATFPSQTDTIEGSSIKTTYAVYASKNQVADTYTGKVKYTVIHPNNGEAPVIPPPPQSSCPTSPMISTVASGITYMQDITSSNKSTVLSALTADDTYQIKDNRDEQTYCVGKLADGKLWLLDNLALDLTNSTVLSGMDSSNTNASDTTLGYLKNGGGTTSDKYAITGVVNWTDSPSYASGYSYSDPLVNLAYKDTVSSNATDKAGDYKIGGYYNYCAASAGSYCYGNGTSYGTSSGDATEDICPKGWRMPTGNTSGEYNTLYTNSNYNTYASYRAALHLPLSGYFYSGSADYQGSVGSWWSSTRDTNYDMYYLYAYTSGILLTLSNNRYYGYSVRCALAD